MRRFPLEMVPQLAEKLLNFQHFRSSMSANIRYLSTLTEM